MERTPANRALWQLACRLGGELGLELEETVAGGGSDGNFTSRLTATLDGLGAVGDGAHARHEHLRLEASLQRAALLALLLVAPPLGGTSEIESP
jgi:glutamate carboxypeptidase